MINITTASTSTDLSGILKLQKANHAHVLSIEEVQSQGFVTVDHTFEQLKMLNDLEPHLIAKDGAEIVGYILAMTIESKGEIPILVPLFESFETINYLGKKIADYQYLVVGQVCMAKAYRGQGLFDQCYAAYKALFEHKYDFAITEIAQKNTRSLRAHQRVGFKVIHSYTDINDIDWDVVLWDWD